MPKTQNLDNSGQGKMLPLKGWHWTWSYRLPFLGLIVAAGALVPPGKIVKTGELWAGTPARCMRLMTKQEIEFIPVSAKNYIQLSREYRGAC